MGSGFRPPRPPAKQQGPGSQGQSSPALPYGEGGAGAKTACVAFWFRRALGLWFAARGVFPFAECSCQKLVWGRRCDWTSALCRRAGSRGMAGNCAHEAIVPLILLPQEGKPVGSVFRRRHPAKQQGPGSQGQLSPALPYGERGAGGKNGLRCSLDPRRIGAVVCCRRSVSLCRMQFPEARFGPSVQRGLGAERPSWLKGHGWGWAQKAFARPILFPHQGVPMGSVIRVPETPSKAAGPRDPGAAQPRIAL